MNTPTKTKTATNYKIGQTIKFGIRTSDPRFVRAWADGRVVATGVVTGHLTIRATGKEVVLIRHDIQPSDSPSRDTLAAVDWIIE